MPEKYISTDSGKHSTRWLKHGFCPKNIGVRNDNILSKAEKDAITNNAKREEKSMSMCIAVIADKDTIVCGCDSQISWRTPDGRYIPDRSDYQKLYYIHSYNMAVMMCGAGLLKTWDGRTETFANVCQEFEREHDGGIKLDYPIVTDELIECFRQKSMINPQVDVNLIISGFTSAMPIITLVSIRNGDIRYRDYTLIQGNVCHAGDIPPKEESEHPAWKIMDGCFADRPQLNNPVMYWTSAVQHAIVSLTQIQADWSSTIGGHPTVVALHAGRQNPEVVMKPEWLVL